MKSLDQRYFVPDLSPKDRKTLEQMRPRLIFVAESPHISEIEPDEIECRRPLCGVAGRKWWGLIEELEEGEEKATDVSLEHLLSICKKNNIAVLNAVQYPLDPKVAKKFPLADPLLTLGFHKVAGEFSFKKQKNGEQVKNAIRSLKDRLNHPSLIGLPIHCLGNDAEWFVGQALSSEERESRLKEKIPHPAAWWRRGGLFGQMAKEKLSRVLVKEMKAK